MQTNRSTGGGVAGSFSSAGRIIHGVTSIDDAERHGKDVDLRRVGVPWEPRDANSPLRSVEF